MMRDAGTGMVLYPSHSYMGGKQYVGIFGSKYWQYLCGSDTGADCRIDYPKPDQQSKKGKVRLRLWVQQLSFGRYVPQAVGFLTAFAMPRRRFRPAGALAI
jgi:hypothetical protein